MPQPPAVMWSTLQGQYWIRGQCTLTVAICCPFEGPLDRLRFALSFQSGHVTALASYVLSVWRRNRTYLRRPAINPDATNTFGLPNICEPRRKRKSRLTYRHRSTGFRGLATGTLDDSMAAESVFR